MSLLRKKCFFRRTLLLVSILSIVMLPQTAAARTVSVGLAIGQSSVSVSSSSALSATDGSGKKHALGTTAVFRSAGTNIVVVGNRTLRLPVNLSSRHPLSFNKRRYRGAFRLLSSDSGITLLNVLDLEEYLRGVLKMEVNPAWSMEALKAQAVISRTYAIRSVLQNRGKGGYDLHDTVMSQVYRGMNAEDPKTDQAIRATKGMVLKYGGEIAFTPFHSHSGGATADVATVWGGNMPYLKGVNEDFRTESPHSTWEASLSAAQIEDALRSAGVNVGRLQELRVEQSDPFGRATTLRAIGTSGSKTLKSHSFRMAAGSNVIRSTLFSISSAVSSSSAPIPLTSLSQPKPVPPSLPAGTGVPTSLTPMSAAEE
ncbi:MAG: stage II sporulation protein SpoIID, partial [Synergistetes bacterium HGW-Synergistetes-2]